MLGHSCTLHLDNHVLLQQHCRDCDMTKQCTSCPSAGEILQADQSASEGSSSIHSEAVVEADEPELASADEQVWLLCSRS